MNDKKISLSTMIWAFLGFVVVALVVFGVVKCTGSASWARTVKSISSDYDGGLERTVTLYDYNGEEIDSWSGKFDISENDNEIYFDDEDGKRVIIQGGIVVCEEN